MVSPLEGALEFLEAFGFFNVVLPFLLVFTLIFAILEKTKILGVEDGKSRKNLNAMLSFVFALFVVATKEIVLAIRGSLPQVALILIIVFCFLLLAGSFMKSGEFSFEDNRFWKVFLTIIMFIAVLLVFLNAVKTESGESWLEVMGENITGTLFGSEVWAFILVVVIIIGAILFITLPGKSGGLKSE
jgi:preprotein translocase subunit SecG